MGQSSQLKKAGVETGNKATVMVLGAKTPELNTAGAPEERAARYQQERECQRGRTTAENLVQRPQQDWEHHRQPASLQLRGSY